MTEGVLITVVTLAVGALLPFVTEWLNVQFKANEGKALAITGIASGVLALLVLLVTGNLALTDLVNLNRDTFTHVFTGIFTLGTIVFNLIKNKMGWNVKR